MKHITKFFVTLASVTISVQVHGQSSWAASVTTGTMYVSPASTKVGIGTATPSVPLTVVGTNTAPTTANFTGGALSVGGSGTNLVLQTGVNSIGSVYSWLQSRNQTGAYYYDIRLNQLGGNVGIGANSPIQTLDVTGRMHISDGVIQRGGPAITTTSDLGLYSLLSGYYMRFVTNNAPVKFFTDGGTNPIGGTERFAIDPSGFVTVSNNLEVGPIAVRSSAIMAQIWATNNNTGIYLTTRHTSNYGYGMKVDVDKALTKALAVVSPTGENFVVFGDGAVFAREVKVMLGTFAHPDYVFEKNYKLMPLRELENYLAKNKHLPNVPSTAEVATNNGISLGEMSTKQLEKIEELTLYIIELNKKLEGLNKTIEDQQQQINLLKDK